MHSVVEAALRILNYSQTQFHFDLNREELIVSPSQPGEECAWLELEEILTKEKARLAADYIIGVLDQPIENNWFSRAIPGKNVIFITTWSWDYISNLPLCAFVAYEMIENVVELLIQKDASEQEWLFKTVVHSDETRGCLSDLCATKSHISFKMRTGDICADCMSVLKARLSGEKIQAIVEMLEETRLIALGRKEEPRVSSEMALSWLVDNRYPFPIAYCFRAMRSELAYSRKWSFLYDVYKLLIRYLAFALLADRSHRPGIESSNLDLSKLGFGSDGQWGWVAFKLAEELMRNSDGSFFGECASALTSESLEAGRTASKALVATRNEKAQGHAWTNPEQYYQHLFERHFADLKTLLTFIKPLANYDLLTAAGAVQPVASKWGWEAKYMMGSNPSFTLSRQITGDHPNSHCVLSDGSGKLLSLQPWILLSYCESCFREMVFLYNKLDYALAEHTEYPTNHSRKNRELGNDVRRQLGV